MTDTWWEHRRKELLWSIWIVVGTILALAVTIIATDGTRLPPIAGGCLAGVFLIYEVVQYDLHMRRKDDEGSSARLQDNADR